MPDGLRLLNARHDGLPTYLSTGSSGSALPCWPFSGLLLGEVEMEGWIAACAAERQVVELHRRIQAGPLDGHSSACLARLQPVSHSADETWRLKRQV